MTDKLNQFKEQVATLIDTMKGLVTEVVEEEHKQVGILLSARAALVQAQATHEQISDVANDAAQAMDEVADYAAEDVHKYVHLIDTLSTVSEDGTIDDIEDSPLYTQGSDDGYNEGYNVGYDEGYNAGYDEGLVNSDAYDNGYNDCIKDHSYNDDDDTADEEEGE